MVAKPVTDAVKSGAPSSSARKRHAVSGPKALELDPLIHERVRLGIISALAVNDELSFNDLKKLLEITDGNLSVHARKLENAGYVKCCKSFVGRQPRTSFKVTAAGKHALESYLAQMESVIRSARK
jgi:DNA-binding MarR family transcriptional regulator